ncbi:hypothetical protein FRC03_001737 [Tulasnella sp. 419]|nr:hypothetical protein FRC03_001737 [Tulasnella sp. 419]
MLACTHRSMPSRLSIQRSSPPKESFGQPPPVDMDQWLFSASTLTRLSCYLVLSSMRVITSLNCQDTPFGSQVHPYPHEMNRTGTYHITLQMSKKITYSLQ